MNDNLQSLMQEATRLTQAGRLAEATDVIQRALVGGADRGRAAPDVSRAVIGDPWVLDDCVIEVVDERPSVAPHPASAAPAAAARSEESFNDGSFAGASRALEYKLYSPPAAASGRALPLVVMLHGCTQNPDDFAAGTGMNEAARDQGFYVLYPAQATAANPQRCWSWFKHNHQQRGQGEPALIAGITRQVMRQHSIDARRVYIAGLSAGGAMAAIVAEAYPDLFAAVGVHSGLAIGAASNVSEALSAMKSGAPERDGTVVSPTRRPGANHAVPQRSNKLAACAVSVIVFHGDQDQTVHQRNGEQVIAAALAADPAADVGRSRGSSSVRVEMGVAPGGRRYTRSLHSRGPGAASAEHWLVHGAGHAWSGGRAAGSYTDAKGPDATREMLRFFFEHLHANPAAGLA